MTEPRYSFRHAAPRPSALTTTLLVLAVVALMLAIVLMSFAVVDRVIPPPGPAPSPSCAPGTVCKPLTLRGEPSRAEQRFRPHGIS